MESLKSSCFKAHELLHHLENTYLKRSYSTLQRVRIDNDIDLLIKSMNMLKRKLCSIKNKKSCNADVHFLVEKLKLHELNCKRNIPNSKNHTKSNIKEIIFNRVELPELEKKNDKYYPLNCEEKCNKSFVKLVKCHNNKKGQITEKSRRIKLKTKSSKLNYDKSITKSNDLNMKENKDQRYIMSNKAVVKIDNESSDKRKTIKNINTELNLVKKKIKRIESSPELKVLNLNDDDSFRSNKCKLSNFNPKNDLDFKSNDQLNLSFGNVEIKKADDTEGVQMKQEVCEKNYLQKKLKKCKRKKSEVIELDNCNSQFLENDHKHMKSLKCNKKIKKSKMKYKDLNELNLCDNIKLQDENNLNYRVECFMPKNGDISEINKIGNANVEKTKHSKMYMKLQSNSLNEPCLTDILRKNESHGSENFITHQKKDQIIKVKKKAKKCIKNKMKPYKKLENVNFKNKEVKKVLKHNKFSLNKNEWKKVEILGVGKVKTLNVQKQNCIGHASDVIKEEKDYTSFNTYKDIFEVKKVDGLQMNINGTKESTIAKKFSSDLIKSNSGNTILVSKELKSLNYEIESFKAHNNRDKFGKVREIEKDIFGVVKVIEKNECLKLKQNRDIKDIQIRPIGINKFKEVKSFKTPNKSNEEVLKLQNLKSLNHETKNVVPVINNKLIEIKEKKIDAMLISSNQILGNRKQSEDIECINIKKDKIATKKSKRAEYFPKCKGLNLNDHIFKPKHSIINKEIKNFKSLKGNYKTYSKIHFQDKPYICHEDKLKEIDIPKKSENLLKHDLNLEMSLKTLEITPEHDSKNLPQYLNETPYLCSNQNKEQKILKRESPVNSNLVNKFPKVKNILNNDSFSRGSFVASNIKQIIDLSIDDTQESKLLKNRDTSNKNTSPKKIIRNCKANQITKLKDNCQSIFDGPSMEACNKVIDFNLQTRDTNTSIMKDMENNSECNLFNLEPNEQQTFSNPNARVISINKQMHIFKHPGKKKTFAIFAIDIGDESEQKIQIQMVDPFSSSHEIHSRDYLLKMVERVSLKFNIDVKGNYEYKNNDERINKNEFSNRYVDCLVGLNDDPCINFNSELNSFNTNEKVTGRIKHCDNEEFLCIKNIDYDLNSIKKIEYGSTESNNNKILIADKKVLKSHSQIAALVTENTLKNIYENKIKQNNEKFRSLNNENSCIEKNIYMDSQEKLKTPFFPHVSKAKNKLTPSSNCSVLSTPTSSNDNKKQLKLHKYFITKAKTSGSKVKNHKDSSSDKINSCIQSKSSLSLKALQRKRGSELESFEDLYLSPPKLTPYWE